MNRGFGGAQDDAQDESSPTTVGVRLANGDETDSEAIGIETPAEKMGKLGVFFYQCGDASS